MISLIGNCTSFNYCACSQLHPSVKDLESHVTSLESEVDRLSQSLNAQRAVVTVTETSARKVAEEHAREASSQVCPPSLRDPESDVISTRHER